MDKQKGFSLIEVLLSLMLVLSLGLGLIQQSGQTQQLISQLLVREKNSQFLDQGDEYSLVRSLPTTYKNPTNRLMKFNEGKGLLTRSRSPIRIMR